MEAEDFLIIAENLTIVYRREVRFFGKAVQNGTATLRAETASGSIVLAGPHPASMIDNCLLSLSLELAEEKPVIKMREISHRNNVTPQGARPAMAVKACV